MRPRANINLPPLRKSSGSGGSGGHVEAREGGRAVKEAAWGVVSEGTKASAETKGEPKAAAADEQESGGVDVSGKRPGSEARSRRSLDPLGIVDDGCEQADAVDVGQDASGGERGVDTGRCNQMIEMKGVPSSPPSQSKETNTVAQEDEDGGGGEEQDVRARRATDAELAKEREVQEKSVHQPAGRGNGVDDDDRDGLRGKACVILKSVSFAGDGSGGSDAVGDDAAGGDGGGAIDIFSQLRRVAEDAW